MLYPVLLALGYRLVYRLYRSPINHTSTIVYCLFRPIRLSKAVKARICAWVVREGLTTFTPLWTRDNHRDLGTRHIHASEFIERRNGRRVILPAVRVNVVSI